MITCRRQAEKEGNEQGKWSAGAFSPREPCRDQSCGLGRLRRSGPKRGGYPRTVAGGLQEGLLQGGPFGHRPYGASAKKGLAVKLTPLQADLLRRMVLCDKGEVDDKSGGGPLSKEEREGIRDLVDGGLAYYEPNRRRGPDSPDVYPTPAGRKALWAYDLTTNN